MTLTAAFESQESSCARLFEKGPLDHEIEESCSRFWNDANESFEHGLPDACAKCGRNETRDRRCSCSVGAQ